MDRLSLEGVAVSGRGRGSLFLSMDYYREMEKKLGKGVSKKEIKRGVEVM